MSPVGGGCCLLRPDCMQLFLGGWQVVLTWGPRLQNRQLAGL